LASETAKTGAETVKSASEIFLQKTKKGCSFGTALYCKYVGSLPKTTNTLTN